MSPTRSAILGQMLIPNVGYEVSVVIIVPEVLIWDFNWRQLFSNDVWDWDL
jgi:hypothetical protein